VCILFGVAKQNKTKLWEILNRVSPAVVNPNRVKNMDGASNGLHGLFLWVRCETKGGGVLFWLDLEERIGSIDWFLYFSAALAKSNNSNRNRNSNSNRNRNSNNKYSTAGIPTETSNEIQ